MYTVGRQRLTSLLLVILNDCFGISMPILVTTFTLFGIGYTLDYNSEYPAVPRKSELF